MQAGFNKVYLYFKLMNTQNPIKFLIKLSFYTGSSKYMIKHFKNIQLLLKINWEKKI